MTDHGKDCDCLSCRTDPLAGLSDAGRRIVDDLLRQSRELAAAHERLDIYAVPPGPIADRLEWWFRQDAETLDALIKAKGDQ